MAITKSRTAITFAERCAIERLARCTFQVGSSDKRFARNMASFVTGPLSNVVNGITDAQRDYLWRLVYRYRRQILQQEHLKDAQLSGVGNGSPTSGTLAAFTIISQPHNKVHIKELVSIARLHDEVMGLRRRVAALRREATQV